MIITNQHITMTRGDSGTITVSIQSHTLVSGEKIEMTVRKTIDSKDKVLYFTVTAFQDGKAVIVFAPQTTANLSFGEYVYDIQYTDANGNVYTIIKPSKFTIAPEVTY